MSYETSVVDGRYTLSLVREPTHCHALPYAPMEMEPVLATGMWLVLNYAVWSCTDTDAIRQAIDVSQEFSGDLQVGLRPFERHDEIRRWCPLVAENAASPVWVFLKSGVTVRVLTCARSNEELANVIRELQM